MGLRKTILATGETYHVFNRSAHKIPIFKSQGDFRIFQDAMAYYLQPFPPLKFSMYRREKNLHPIDLEDKMVKILNYCLMPTHFHFTLRQIKEAGIRLFIQKLTNSYAHYFNKKNETLGPVFTGNFKAVRVENDEQLLHLSRYIHLNPVTDYLVEKPEDYLFSSYRLYLGLANSSIVEPALIMKDAGPQNYKKFVEDNIDYQRKLGRIKHLILE